MKIIRIVYRENKFPGVKTYSKRNDIMRKNRKNFAEEKSLLNIKPGSSAQIRSIETESSMRRRLRDLGLIEGTEVRALTKSPSGDPVAYLIRGATIAIRNEDSSRIFVC